MTVLIVDDILDNRKTISLLLEDVDGIEILEAINGQEAVDICSTKNIDLVLMDVMMPVMDGIEATKIINKMEKKPIIVAVSALGDDNKKREMLKSGAQDYITKPLNDELFIARIKNYKTIRAALQDGSPNNEWAINPFASKVYSRKVMFRVTKESSLAEFWEFYLLGDNNVVDENLSDCVRAIYNSGLALLRTLRLFDIVVEEDDNMLYFTVLKIEGYNKETIEKIFEKTFSHSVRRFGEAAFSVKLDKSKGDIDKNQAISRQQAKEVNASSSCQVDFVDIKVQKTASEDEKILRTSFVNKTNAVGFLSELEDSYFDKIDSLEETEDELDRDIFDLETSGKVDYIYKIAKAVSSYANVIDSLHEFGNIYFALNKLYECLLGIKTGDLNEKKLAKLTLILKCLHSDLMQWRENIFVNKNAIDIHYLDSSLISSCMQIDNEFNAQAPEDNSSDDDLELF